MQFLERNLKEHYFGDNMDEFVILVEGANEKSNDLEKISHKINKYAFNNDKDKAENRGLIGGIKTLLKLLEFFAL